LDPESVTAVEPEELVADDAERHPGPGVHLIWITTVHQRSRMEAEVLPHPAATEPRALEERRRADGACRKDDDGRIDGEPCPRAARRGVEDDAVYALERSAPCPLAKLDTLGPDIGEKSGAGRKRARDVGDERALLGAVAAPDRTAPRAHAPLRIEVCSAVAPAEAPRPVEERAVGGRVCVVGDDSGVHLLLDQVEDGREVAGAHAAGPVYALPFVEHV